MNAVIDYLVRLSRAIGAGWNRFWFTPSDPIAVCVLRILIGLAGFYFVLSYTADLPRWFGSHGMLSVSTVNSLELSADEFRTGLQQPVRRYSYLDYASDDVQLWLVHAAGLLVLLALTLGVATRVTSILSLVVVLSYINRAAMLTGQFEPVLSMMLLYLCLAPAGACLSVDQWLRGKRSRAGAAQRESLEDRPRYFSATLAVRLMQVHLAVFYLAAGLAKVAGLAWWDGTATWWLIAHTESRLVDLTFLHTFPFLVYAWTHSVVAIQLGFPLLIWNRLARPLLLGLAVIMWLGLALITGLVSYCVFMALVSFVFVSPVTMRAVGDDLLARLGVGRLASQTASA